jgi:hypothetical protein
MIVEQMGCWLDVEINGISCLEFVKGHMVNSQKEMKGLDVDMTLGLNVWMLEPQKVPLSVEQKS